MGCKKALLLLGITSALVCIMFYAPRYLSHSESFCKSDAVILFVGPDYKARKKEAHRLIEEGYGHFLLVPAFEKILKWDEQAGLTEAKKDPIDISLNKKYRQIYENTHLEVLYAKEMMNMCNLESAILVSSPVHMRRIKIIADGIFEQEKYALSYVPTRYEKRPGNLWWTDMDGLKQILSEYVKIAWFLIYSTLPL